MKLKRTLIPASLVLGCALIGSALTISAEPSTVYTTSAVGDLVINAWKEDFDSIQNEIENARAPQALAKRAATESHVLDKQSLIWDSDRDPLDVALRRTEALLNDLSLKPKAPDLRGYVKRFNDIKLRAAATGLRKSAAAQRQSLYLETRALGRKLAFDNPLLDFNEIIFISGNIGTGGFWQHMGFNNSWGGNGLYVLSNWKTAPALRKVLKDSYPIPGTTNSGIFQGFHLNYDLSYDAKTVYFGARWGQDVWGATYPCRIMKASIDGSQCIPLTFATCNSGYPCVLPSGRIAYASQCHRKGDRCEGTSTTLYSMKDDGSDSYEISWHETPEYFPVVTNDGMIAYGRWDYVDRSFQAAQHLWVCWPDGRDSRSPHANYPYPQYTVDGGCYHDGRCDRPSSEQWIQTIPGTTGKYMAIAGTHHNNGPGTPILIDVNIPDDNKMSQVKIITGCLPMEDESCLNPNPVCNTRPNYVTPWPLSEDYYLVSDTKAICLLDKFGTKEIIYQAPDNVIGVGYIASPKPLRPRTRPPVLSMQTWQGERAGLSDHKRAVMSVMNVYQSDFTWPAGVKVKALRIIQITPRKTDEGWLAGHAYEAGNMVHAGYGQEAGRVITRAVLGTVPVEDDGSAYFEAPVGKEFYFQAIDDRGLAIQSMRSGTYVHPGEHLSCAGCHEDKWKAVPVTGVPKALQRLPSKITPEVDGSCPVNFYRLVNPVFENKCLPCHKSQNKGLQSFKYDDLRDKVYWQDAKWAGLARQGGHRSLVMRVGALESPMGKKLLATHTARITAEELHRVTLWMDANSMRFGAFHDTAAQLSGQVVWPYLEIDPNNPTGIENNYPAPGAQSIVQDLRNKGLIDKNNADLKIRTAGRRVIISGMIHRNFEVTVYDCAGRCVLRRMIDGNEVASPVTILFDRSIRPGSYAIAVRSGDRIARKIASIL